MKNIEIMVVRIIFLVNLALLPSCTYDTVSSSIENVKKSDPTNRSYQNTYYEINSNISEDIGLRLININLDNILISLKFTTYNSYISFDIDNMSKNKYLQINIERGDTDSLKDINKKIRIFQQKNSDEGLIVFLSSSAPFPNYTAFMFNNTAIYHSYSFDLQQYDCSNFDSFMIEDGLIKHIYISQGKKECDVKIISDETVLPSISSSKNDKYSTQNIREDFNNRVILNGKYYYSTYHTNEETGTGIGEITTINISEDKCFIDIVGYQADNHFECNVIDENKHYIDVISLRDNSKFAEIAYDQEDNYSINITYYDDYISLDEVDNNFYPLEKLE